MVFFWGGIGVQIPNKMKRDQQKIALFGGIKLDANIWRFWRESPPIKVHEVWGGTLPETNIAPENRPSQ